MVDRYDIIMVVCCGLSMLLGYETIKSLDWTTAILSSVVIGLFLGVYVWYFKMRPRNTVPRIVLLHTLPGVSVVGVVTRLEKLTGERYSVYDSSEFSKVVDGTLVVDYDTINWCIRTAAATCSRVMLIGYAIEPERISYPIERQIEFTYDLPDTISDAFIPEAFRRVDGLSDSIGSEFVWVDPKFEVVGFNETFDEDTIKELEFKTHKILLEHSIGSAGSVCDVEFENALRQIYMPAMYNTTSSRTIGDVVFLNEDMSDIRYNPDELAVVLQKMLGIPNVQ
jgi:hypothetical protein